ncbi:MAG: hypothetical protein ABJO67_02875 [Pseudoruegeria sp.]
MTDHDDFDLELFFDAAQTQTADASTDLLLRIAGDADAILDARDTPVGSTPIAKVGFLAGLVAMIGGWSAVAGVSTAAVAGLWFGIMAPTGVSALTNGYLTDTSETAYVSDYLPGFDLTDAGE